MRLNPLENIPIHLFPVCFIQNLMTILGIQLHGHIIHKRPITLKGFLHPFAERPYRVILPGYEIQRYVPLQLGKILRLIDEPDRIKQISVNRKVHLGLEEYARTISVSLVSQLFSRPSPRNLLSFPANTIF